MRTRRSGVVVSLGRRGGGARGVVRLGGGGCCRRAIAIATAATLVVVTEVVVTTAVMTVAHAARSIRAEVDEAELLLARLDGVLLGRELETLELHFLGIDLEGRDVDLFVRLDRLELEDG